MNQCPAILTPNESINITAGAPKNLDPAVVDKLEGGE
jgi:hypothetical protein